MFLPNTYRTLSMMTLLSRYYGRGAVSIDCLVTSCLIDAETVKSLLWNMEELGLVQSSSASLDDFYLTKSPEDILLYDFIQPLEPSIFSGSTGMNADLMVGQIDLFYRKFHSFQEGIEMKLRCCRLSDWCTITDSNLCTI